MKTKHFDLTEEKMDKTKTFWVMWSDELPGSFPKRELIENLMHRWNISMPNVYARLKAENFMSLKSDLAFMFDRYGIAFDCKGKGFFLDQRQFDLIRQTKDMEAAQLFGLSK